MWSATIRTGSPEVDLRTVEEQRARAHQQGLVLHVQPLPHGGFWVQALPHGAPPAAPDPGAQFGGTLPSAPHQPGPAAHAGYVPMPMPGPTAGDPMAQFGGTLPSQPQGFAARAQRTPEIHMHPSAQYGGMGQCQSCGREGPTKDLTFMQNVGAVIIRFPKTVSGHLCKFCAEQHFFKMTLITFFFGWWGVISFFYTLVSLPVNVVNRIKAISLAPPREDAESVAEKRSRGLWLILLGCFLGLLALLHLAFTALALAGGAEIEDVIGLLVAGMFVDLPPLFLIIAGVRDRVAASRAARQLGIA